MEPESEISLRNLATHPNVFVAIISGRGPQDVQKKVAIENVTYAGNHGLEINFASGKKYTYEVSAQLKDSFTKLVDALEKLCTMDGAWVENKQASLTFHYRCAAPEYHEELNRNIIETVESYGYLANQAHFSVEAKPPVKWNKGMDRIVIENWHIYDIVCFFCLNTLVYR